MFYNNFRVAIQLDHDNEISLEFNRTTLTYLIYDC